MKLSIFVILLITQMLISQEDLNIIFDKVYVLSSESTKQERTAELFKNWKGKYYRNIEGIGKVIYHKIQSDSTVIYLIPTQGISKVSYTLDLNKGSVMKYGEGFVRQGKISN